MRGRCFLEFLDGEIARGRKVAIGIGVKRGAKDAARLEAARVIATIVEVFVSRGKSEQVVWLFEVLLFEERGPK
jgi:hypothetical protein